MTEPIIVLRAEAADDIRACYAVFAELRPHLSEAEFTARAGRQMKNHGYRIVYIRDGPVAAAAGYRVAEFMAWGRTLYLDDLVTAASARGRGYGGALMDWLLAEARSLGCAEFHLDSGVQRHDAHRLYLGRKLRISSHHFSKELS